MSTDHIVSSRGSVFPLDRHRGGHDIHDVSEESDSGFAYRLTGDGSWTIITPGVLDTSSADAGSIILNTDYFKLSRKTSDQTTTSASATDVTSMSFAIGADEVWLLEIYGEIGCNNTGGVKFSYNVPASCVFSMQTLATRGTANTLVHEMLQTDDTLSTNNFCIASSRGFFQSVGTIVNSSTAGTVQLRFASGTATQTSTVFANTILRAWRVT